MKKPILFCILTFVISQITFAQNYGWTDISANILTEADLSDVFFVSDNEGWITSSSEAVIYHTTDGGLTFEIQTTLLSTNAIHMLNENVGYTGGESGFVYRTTDGGGNWNFHGTTVSTLADISFPPSGNTGYCCGINGNIWSIDSSGVTKMTSGVPDNLYSLGFPVNSEEGWVCGGSIIRHFINEEWSAADQDYPSGGYNAIYMVDSLNGWTVGDGGIIAHTTDGKNWFEQTNPNPQQNTFYDVFFLNNQEGWAVGLSWVIEHTSNGGVDWTIQHIGDLYEPAFTGIHFTSPTNGYVVGSGKTLWKYTEVSGIGDERIPVDFEVFPNPVHENLYIKCSDLKTENGTIQIHRIDGKEILKTEVRQGNESIEIDLDKLESGMYLCKIIIGNRSSIKKIIKD